MLRADLIDVLTTVAPGLSQKDILPVLGCFCFRDGRVFTYDDSVGISVPCDFPMLGAVRGDKLLGTLKASRAKDVTVAQDGDNATFKVGRAKVVMPMIEPDEFAFDWPKLSKKKALGIGDETLDAIQAVSVAMGTDVSYPSRLGVTLAGDEVFATDNYLVARHGLNSSDWPEVVLPPRFVELLLANRRRSPESIWVHKEYVAVSCNDGTIIYGKTVAEGDPSQFAVLFDEIPQDMETFDLPKGLDSALEKAVIYLDPDDPHTSIKVADGKMTLRTSSSAGVSTERLKIDKNHPDVEVKTSPLFLRKILKSVTGLRVHPEIRAILLSNEDGSFSVMSALVDEVAEIDE